MAVVRDLKLDATGDLAFDGHDLAVAADAEAIAQQAGIALSTFAGEVYFDTEAGASWHALLGDKRATPGDFEAEVRRVLGAVPGIASVDKVTVARDGARVGTILVEATADTGALLAIKAEV